MIEIGSRTRVRSIASATLLIEATLIASVVSLADGHYYHVPLFLLPAMLAAAMGVQTATLPKVGSLTVHTTFVTGMLNKLAQLLSHGAFLTYDMFRGRDVIADRRRILRQARFMFSIWVFYLLGAVTGTLAEIPVGHSRAAFACPRRRHRHCCRSGHTTVYPGRARRTGTLNGVVSVHRLRKNSCNSYMSWVMLSEAKHLLLMQILRSRENSASEG